jgi:YHS domain-containing protein
MPKVITSVVFVVLVLAAGSAVLAADAKSPKPQALCPVGGEPIDKSSFSDFQGQRVYFCCDACKSKFAQEPEKYFAKMAEAGVVAESIQTTCPVSGEKLKRGSVFAELKGRRVYFCCNKCKATFEKEPTKYLGKLPGGLPAAT